MSWTQTRGKIGINVKFSDQKPINSARDVEWQREGNTKADCVDNVQGQAIKTVAVLRSMSNA
jgi:hypothetical protein